MPPILNRLLIIGGILTILFSVTMYITPVIYNHIYLQGWNDAELFYLNKPPTVNPPKKQPSIEEGIWI